ncbi:electron transport complex subunit RsxC [Bacteroidales bacterium OttesenSCG-928-I14]|nr:electron transport complex subunit RsxC [Bacteroidales bacterium OttesenSCG-928-I14]
MLKTFKIGGIHPPGRKLSAGRRVETLIVPDQVIIPLSQSLGSPSIPVVAKGDNVKVGTLIAKSSGFISANIHSSVSGTVVKIDKAIDVSGYKRDAIYIKVEGDEWEESIDRSPDLVRECSLSSKEIIDKIEAAGIVGLGGATFPTNVKLLSGVGKVDSLIINATECEPCLTDDHSLMLLKREEILVGTHILMKAIEVKKAYIGIENNKDDVIEILSRIALDYPGIEVVALKEKYPQGGEKQLIDAILKRQVPSGKLPADVGCVVQNIGTTFAVYEAIQKNKPLVERIITFTGKGVDAKDYLVRIGTQVSYLLTYPLKPIKPYEKIIAGGPMMGKALVSSDVPISKGVSGILLMDKDEAHRRPARDCIRCGQCVQACPMGLVPNSLMTFAEFEDWDKAEKFHIYDCLECGSCMYVCPSNRPLLDYIRLGKAKVLTIRRNRK